MSELVQRLHQRTEVNWIAIIRLTDGRDFPCTVRDVSQSGLKICASADLELPETFMIRVVGRQLVFQVKQAWRRRHDIGVVIEKIAKVAEPSSAPVETKPQVSYPGESHSSLGSRRRYGM